MNSTQMVKDNFETIGWGALLIWWGAAAVLTFLPPGVGAIGTGLILLGLNVVRSLNGVPTRRFTTTLGILALVLGGLEIASVVLRLPFEIPILAILMIVLGLIIVGHQVFRNKNE